jgi:epoxide hydrolase 4
MLFLHGFPEFWYEWRNLMPRFENDFLVVAPDLRGYNLSDKPERVEDYAVSSLIGDVAGLIDHYSTEEKATIVGHDWGGVVAWAYAIAHPDRVDKLIIINAPHPAIFMRELALNPEQQKASSYIHKFKMPEAESRLSEDAFARLKRMVFETASHSEVFPSDVQKEYVKAWSQAGALTGGLNYYRASRIFPGEAPGFLAKLVVRVTTRP